MCERAKKLVCKRHPRYKALKKPQCLCEDCWRMWLNEVRIKEGASNGK